MWQRAQQFPRLTLELGFPLTLMAPSSIENDVGFSGFDCQPMSVRPSNKENQSWWSALAGEVTESTAHKDTAEKVNAAKSFMGITPFK